MKIFLDCSRCLAGQCPYNGRLGSSICLLRSLLLATVRLIADGAIPARMYRLSMFVDRISACDSATAFVESNIDFLCVYRPFPNGAGIFCSGVAQSKSSLLFALWLYQLPKLN